jgi:lipoate---protein ligase
MSDWQVIDTGCQSAEENMRLDAELLEGADAFSHPILHFYEWTGDSATYGCFTDPAELLNLDKVRQLSLQLARRPTGGGIVFHVWDMAFSVLIPAICCEYSLNTLQNYAFVNNAVLAAVKEFLDQRAPLALIPEDFISWDPDCFHFCMAKPTKYDVVWEGRKIAGAAQRKTRKGFLHQGTIALVPPNIDDLDQILLPGTRVRDAMLAHTCPLLEKSSQKSEINAAKQRLRILLTTHLNHASLTLRP